MFQIPEFLVISKGLFGGTQGMGMDTGIKLKNIVIVGKKINSE
jgi:hypothetical protein